MTRSHKSLERNNPTNYTTYLYGFPLSFLKSAEQRLVNSMIFIEPSLHKISGFNMRVIVVTHLFDNLEVYRSL